MKRIILLIGAILCIATTSWGKITIGASLPDLGSIAATIGGDRVETFSIARSSNDPHSVEVLPTYMVRVSRADVYLKVGLGLDQWSDQILEGARNSKIAVIDCSRGIIVLEKPTTKVDASLGDVHPEGNPHYWLDPANGLIIARTIADALIQIDPAGSANYSKNLAVFESELHQKLGEWESDAASLPNHYIVTYHSSWVYFAKAFGFNIAAKIEPVPGIPPTANHLVELVKIIQDQQVKLVIQEPYFSDDGANYLARETGVRILKLAPSCSDVSAASYLNHFQEIINALKRGV
jgi:zinc/manganese transport system substrate-binding protein